MPLARHAVVGSQGLALPSRSTPTRASPDIFWQSKPHSKIGKQCKTSVARTGPRITSLASGVAILTRRADQGRDCGAAEFQRMKLPRAGLTAPLVWCSPPQPPFVEPLPHVLSWSALFILRPADLISSCKSTLNGARSTYKLRPDRQLERRQGLA